MKMRIGFVSNSSSSSFVIDLGHHSTDLYHLLQYVIGDELDLEDIKLKLDMDVIVIEDPDSDEVAYSEELYLEFINKLLEKTHDN